MRNILDIDKYMEFEVSEYLKEACEMFEATNPSIGSDALAYTLLDHAFLKMCGHLEQKLTSMAWFIGYHDVEEAKNIYDNIMYDKILDIKNTNKMWEKYDYRNLNKGHFMDAVKGRLKNKLEERCKRYFGFPDMATLGSYICVIKDYTDCQASVFITDYVREPLAEQTRFDIAFKAAVDYRNIIAHNKRSIYNRSFGLSDIEETTYPNIYKYIFIMIFFDEILRAMFSDYAAALRKGAL